MGIQERKEREKEQRKNEIINAAEKVFFEKGIENATMDEIAEVAELSKGTLYLYFKNKEALHFAICTRGMNILKNRFEKIIDPKKKVLENLIIIGIDFVNFSKTHSDYFKVMSYFEGKSGPDYIEEHTHSEKDDVMEFLVQLIKKGIQDKSLRNDLQPCAIAHVLWAQLTGVMQLMSVKDLHTDCDKISEKEMIYTHFAIIANGMVADGTEFDIKKYFKN